ncbi:MAG: hypothetical protein US20_C0023G0021 [Candidatus Pacebacteria bacterium GW2011_GWF1_36_5]|nr:MAG: hypothetical protein US20_C0023G0021 [Candidatus Pacebacteria bacterium GW2011_GWF1_36_5]
MSYDQYLDRMIEDYNKGCEPERIEPSSEYHSGDYNCNHCDHTDCEYWKEYNDFEVIEDEEPLK